MLNNFYKQLFYLVVRCSWRARHPRWPGAVLIQWRCARRIDGTTRRLMRMRGRIRLMSGHLLSGAIKGALDPDGTLCRMLDELKEETRTLRYQLAQWHVKECKGRAGVRLKASMSILNRIAADTYAAADKLAWDIVEHDRAVGAGSAR